MLDKEKGDDISGPFSTINKAQANANELQEAWGDKPAWEIVQVVGYSKIKKS